MTIKFFFVIDNTPIFCVVHQKMETVHIMFNFGVTDPSKNFHCVVDCGHNIMKEHRYWPLVSDLNNVLSHRPIAIKFMSDDNLLEMWFAFLSMFQGENTAGVCC